MARLTMSLLALLPTLRLEVTRLTRLARAMFRRFANFHRCGNCLGISILANFLPLRGATTPTSSSSIAPLTLCPPTFAVFSKTVAPTCSITSTDPFVIVEKTPAEHKNQFIYLDKYGRFPFELLPRSYKAAVSKFGKSKLESNAFFPGSRRLQREAY